MGEILRRVAAQAGQADFSAVRFFCFLSSLFQFLSFASFLALFPGFFSRFLLFMRLLQLSEILQYRRDSGQEKASAETRGWGRLRFHS